MQGDACGIPLGTASPPQESRRTALHALRSAFGAGSLRSMVSGRPAAASGRSARAVDCTHWLSWPLGASAVFTGAFCGIVPIFMNMQRGIHKALWALQSFPFAYS